MKGLQEKKNLQRSPFSMKVSHIGDNYQLKYMPQACGIYKLFFTTVIVTFTSGSTGITFRNNKRVHGVTKSRTRLSNWTTKRKMSPQKAWLFTKGHDDCFAFKEVNFPLWLSGPLAMEGKNSTLPLLPHLTTHTHTQIQWPCQCVVWKSKTRSRGELSRRVGR